MSLKIRNKLEDLIQILKNLRSPDGCDWDKKQTHESLIPYLLEETYEVIAASKNNDYKLLKDDIYEVFIDTSLKPGSLTYGELIIKGKSV